MELACSALLFDLDGVLIDSSAVVRRHWQEWAHRNNVSFEHLMSVAYGRTSTEIIRLVAPQLNAEEQARRYEAEEGIDTDGLRVFPAAHQLVLSLPDHHWAVVTSGKLQTALTRLRFGGYPKPEVLLTADDVQRGKPAPDGYLLAARRLGFAPSTCLVVEDAPAGIQAAHAAGMKVIAVATTYEPRRLRQADFILQDIATMTAASAGDQLRVELKPIADDQ